MTIAQYTEKISQLAKQFKAGDIDRYEFESTVQSILTMFGRKVRVIDGIEVTELLQKYADNPEVCAMVRALGVISLDKRINAFLAVSDPKALAQVNHALSFDERDAQ